MEYTQLWAMQARIEELQQVIGMLQDAVAYARNRLDADNDQPQVAGDLAVAWAWSVSKAGELGKIK